jgi:hypothetical protein
MKKIGILCFSFLLSLQAFAGGFYQQLCAFNPNWKKYAHRAPEGDMRPITCDRAYVQAHLGAVLGILHTNPTSQLNAAQLHTRMQMLQWLREYREAGQFPLNYYRLDRIPVFIDEHNTHCAVGYLLMKTGHDDIAQRIAATDNYVLVKDLKDPEVVAWQQTSGLTLEELKLIQGYYDSYLDNAFFLPNKHEIPQKPEVILAYFEDEKTGKPVKNNPNYVWLKGEGSGGILNGKWIQNFAVGIPWIIGWFENGKKTGQWAEYYQGTNKLCRTEIWRNDKLNGLRIRYDRNGNIIEKILFREGKVVTKTNFTKEDTLTWVRRPINDSILYTEVYNAGGALIAQGKEKVYNPGNLQWFQNIELTALNTAAIHASSPVIYTQQSSSASMAEILSARGSSGRRYGYGRVQLFGSPQLVTYLKEGTWMYYKEYNYNASNFNGSLHRSLRANYRHMALNLISGLSMFDDLTLTLFHDSIEVEYAGDQVLELNTHSQKGNIHLKVNYYEAAALVPVRTIQYIGYPNERPRMMVKECGQYAPGGERIGEWRSYTTQGELYKKETYLIAWKED